MSLFTGKRYWVDPELLKNQISELATIKRMLVQLIKDNSLSEEAWHSDLMRVLCEYHTYSYQMIKFLGEILLTKKKRNPETEKKEYLVREAQSLYLESHATLLRILDVELHQIHGISLTMH